MTQSGSSLQIGPLTVSRRNLLFLAGAAAAGVATLGLTYAFNTPQGIVVSIVRQKLPGLDISDDDIRQFADDFIAADMDTSTVEMSGLRVIRPFVGMPPFRWMMPGAIADGIENFERRVITEFALGTDFFTSYAEDRSRVTYMGLFDPYKAPCSNPMLYFTALADTA